MMSTVGKMFPTKYACWGILICISTGLVLIFSWSSIAHVVKTPAVRFKQVQPKPKQFHQTKEDHSAVHVNQEVSSSPRKEHFSSPHPVLDDKDSSLFPYLEYNPFGMQWKSYIEELEWLYEKGVLDQSRKHETFESKFGSFGILSFSRSKLSLVQSNVKKGDYVHVVLVAYDKYGNKRLRGGDFLQAIMSNKELQKWTAGKVKDYGNGTYSLYFYAGWKGDAVITVNLISYRESIIFLNFERNFNNDRLIWAANFTDGIAIETTHCTIINEGIWEDKCYYVNPSGLGKTAFVCDKPKKLSCETLSTTSHSLHALDSGTKEDLGSAAVYFSRQEEPYIGEQLRVKIKDNKDYKFPDLPSCGPDLPVTLSSGYWEDDLTFVPLMCRSQQWEINNIEKCLLRKHLYFYGDSTIQQISLHLRSLRLKNANVTSEFVLLRAGSPIQSFTEGIMEADYIDNIQDCTTITPVVIFNACFHFGAWTTRAYIERLFSTKLAVMRLLNRCPNAIVIIKSAHARNVISRVQSVHSANYVMYDMDRMMRRIFGGIGVRFLDIWDLALSHPAQNGVHMPKEVINQELYLMLSYTCPEMVRTP